MNSPWCLEGHRHFFEEPSAGARPSRLSPQQSPAAGLVHRLSDRSDTAVPHARDKHRLPPIFEPHRARQMPCRLGRRSGFRRRTSSLGYVQAAAGSSRLPRSFDGSTCSVTRPVAIVGRDGDFLPIDPISALVREMSHDQDSVARLMKFPANVRDSWIMAQHLTDLAPGKRPLVKTGLRRFPDRNAIFEILPALDLSPISGGGALRRQGPAISEP